MNKKNVSVLCLLVVAMVLVLVPILGCKATAPPAAKPNKVVIYHFGDLSGPIAASSVPVVTGLTDYIAWLNREKGGIQGVPLEQVYRDTGGKLDAALAAYAAFKEEKPRPFMIFTYGSAEAEALRDRLVEDKIVNCTMAASPLALYPAGYSFATIPAYSDCLGAFIDWVTTDWSKKTGQKVKLAILTWDTSFGRAILVDEMRKYASSKGVEIVAEELFGPRDLDVSTQLGRIKAKGANWVYDNTTAHGPGIINKSAKALGMLNQNLYDTTSGMIHRVSGPWGVVQTKAILMGPAESEGAIGVTCLPFWTETDKSGIQLIASVLEKKGGKQEEAGEGYVIGWVYGALMSEVISRAVDAVGWDKLDGPAVREQFVKLKNFSPLGLVRYSYSADKPEPRDVRIAQVKNAKPVPITDWLSAPDLRPAQYKK